MILVIGAGAAGLATAYFLQKQGVPYCVLEKEEVGSTWSHHYEGLSLHTLKEVSGLPGRPMPAHFPEFPSAIHVTEYLQDYARHFDLNIKTGLTVQQADYHPTGWHVQTNLGDFRADILMVTTGIWNSPYRPRFADEALFEGDIIHANQYQNPRPFVGKRVLVVGIGNTGSEVAVALAEAGAESAVSVRNGVDFVPYPTSAPAMEAAAWLFRTLPRSLGEMLLTLTRKNFSHLSLPPAPGFHIDAYPVVGYELPEAVEAGKVTVYGDIERFIPSGVKFRDGQMVAFDTVILATGYRPTLQFVAHELAFKPNGWPTLNGCQSTRNPYLYCVGYTYPATAGWLQSVGRVANQAVEAAVQQYRTVLPQTVPAR